MQRYLEVPEVNEADFNPKATLPYGLSLRNVQQTLEASHELLQGLNSYLVSKGQPRLEELMLGNAFAGFLSEIIVKSLADHSMLLVRNQKIGGYPDLILKGKYANDQVLRGEGIEVKMSKQHTWQGHNPEAGWLMGFVYRVDTKTQPVQQRLPTEFVEVLAGELNDSDWSFSGRKSGSRRTITASVKKGGLTKLRSNWIYQKSANEKP